MRQADSLKRLCSYYTYLLTSISGAQNIGFVVTKTPSLTQNLSNLCNF